MAEVHDGYGYRSRRYWDNDEEEEEEEDYELIEAYDSEQSIDEWTDREDRRVNFGKIPLAEDELLPAGALDGVKPDNVRVSEATDAASLEMTHHTERVGSPHTLVLTKTRWRHQARLEEYRADLAAMVQGRRSLDAGIASLAGELRREQ